MQLPRLVCLDSSTWGHLARDRQTVSDAKRILALFNSGELIPFFTSHHVEELAQHADDIVFQRRVGLFKTLPFVAFPKLPHDVGNVGGCIELWESEMAVLVRHPEATHEKIMEITRPEITNGFCSGEEFLGMNAEWWEFYRAHFAPDMQARQATVASIRQFPIPGVDPNRKIPRSSKDYRVRKRTEARQYLARQVAWLGKRLREHGDKRLQNPEQLATSFLGNVSEETLPLCDMAGDFFDNWLKSDGIERSRLPRNATIADAGYEFMFAKACSLNDNSLRVPPGTLRQEIRQEMIPSWIVWREIDRAMKRLLKAEGSSWNDSMIVPFALYVEGLEVDKRVKDCVRQAASKHPLLQIVEKKLLRRKNYGDLAEQLEQLASTAVIKRA